jgi:beta-carotene hydroxylase
MYTAEGPWFLLPLKWMTIEYQYYRLYLPLAIRGLLGYTDNNARPFNEAAKSKIHLVTMIVIVAYLWRLDSYSLLCCWILPGRLAAFLLAFAFDYLPHRPHSHTRETDQVLTTSVTSLYRDNSIILTPFLLYQNYHNIHHLAPYIPFYHYLSVWDQVKGDLIERGQLTIPIFGTSEPRKKL